MLFGHLAVSALEYRYAKAELVPVMAAAVAPDLIDKIAHYVLGISSFGRLWGHTLIAAFLSTFIVFLLFGRRSAASWGLGYLSHLVCDIGGVVPWLYPFVSYNFPEAEAFHTTLWMSLTRPGILLEVALVIWAYIALRPQLDKETQRIRGLLREKWNRVQGNLLES
jgi:hypothetical protein